MVVMRYSIHFDPDFYNDVDGPPPEVPMQGHS